MVDENLKQFLENYLSGQTTNGRTYSLRFGRTINCGNFESMHISLEEEFDTSIPRETAFQGLADRVEQLVATRRKIKVPIAPSARG